MLARPAAAVVVRISGCVGEDGSRLSDSSWW